MYNKPVCTSVKWQMRGNVLQNVSSGGGNGSIKGIEEGGDATGAGANVPGRIVWI